MNICFHGFCIQCWQQCIRNANRLICLARWVWVSRGLLRFRGNMDDDDDDDEFELLSRLSPVQGSPRLLPQHHLDSLIHYGMQIQGALLRACYAWSASYCTLYVHGAFALYLA